VGNAQTASECLLARQIFAHAEQRKRIAKAHDMETRVLPKIKKKTRKFKRVDYPSCSRKNSL